MTPSDRRNWGVHVGHAFHWIRESQLLPPAPGSVAVAVYAHGHRVSVQEHPGRVGPTVGVEDVGKAAVDLVVSPGYAPGAYGLTAAGLSRPHRLTP